MGIVATAPTEKRQAQLRVHVSTALDVGRAPHGIPWGARVILDLEIKREYIGHGPTTIALPKAITVFGQSSIAGWLGAIESGRDRSLRVTVVGPP